MSKKRISGIIILSILMSFVLAACQAATPEVQSQPAEMEPAAESTESEPEAEAQEEAAFDLDKLIADAQAEGELVVYWHSSRIEKAGAKFEELYGIKVNGTKMNDAEQTERVVREVDSGNIQVDVLGYDDGGTLVTQLVPENYASIWVPDDMVDVIPASDQDPLIYLWQPRMFGYNTEVYPDGCPIENVWQLTEDDWKGKVIIRDPQVTTAQLGFFAAIVENADMMAEAYQDYYGEALETKEENAGWEYLKRLFSNNIVVLDSDDDVSQAVGAAGQSDPPIGMYTYTKHRNMEENNLHLGICKTMQPFMGYALPTYVVQVNGAKHPNAAKLFTHFVLTEEGVAPWAIEDLGGYSPNPNVGTHPQDEIGSWAKWREYLVTFDPAEAIKIRQDLVDFWLLNAGL